jgi:hypothetical protein
MPDGGGIPVLVGPVDDHDTANRGSAALAYRFERYGTRPRPTGPHDR